MAKDWLALLASLKDLRGVHASAALRRALAAQILSSDASLQQAALKGLKVNFTFPGRDLDPLCEAQWCSVLRTPM